MITARVLESICRHGFIIAGNRFPSSSILEISLVPLLFFAVTVEGSSTLVLQRSSSVAPASLGHVLEASSCVPAASLQRWSPLSLRPPLVVCAAFSFGWRWFERAKNDRSSWGEVDSCEFST